MKTCLRCGRTCDLTEFKSYVKPNGKLYVWPNCNECRRRDSRERSHKYRPMAGGGGDGVDVPVRLNMTELPAPHPLERVVVAGAACKTDEGRELALSRKRGSGLQMDHQRLKDEFCAACPVRLECRDVCDYLEGVGPRRGQYPEWGVWGGETPEERRKRRERHPNRVGTASR